MHRIADSFGAREPHGACFAGPLASLMSYIRGCCNPLGRVLKGVQKSTEEEAAEDDGPDSSAASGPTTPRMSAADRDSSLDAIQRWLTAGRADNAIVVARTLAERLPDDPHVGLALGRTLLATEVRAAQTYWQVKEGSEIYPQPFAAHHLACIVWSTKVDYATWFGSNVEYLFGIQMMPVTPVSELLLDEEWLRQSLPAWERKSSVSRMSVEKIDEDSP